MNDTSGVCMLKPIAWQIWCFEQALNCSVWSAFPVILCEQQMLQLWVDSPDSKNYLKNEGIFMISNDVHFTLYHD